MGDEGVEDGNRKFYRWTLGECFHTPNTVKTPHTSLSLSSLPTSGLGWTTACPESNRRPTAIRRDRPFPKGLLVPKDPHYPDSSLDGPKPSLVEGRHGERGTPLTPSSWTQLSSPFFNGNSEESPPYRYWVEVGEIGLRVQFLTTPKCTCPGSYPLKAVTKSADGVVGSGLGVRLSRTGPGTLPRETRRSSPGSSRRRTGWHFDHEFGPSFD